MCQAALAWVCSPPHDGGASRKQLQMIMVSTDLRVLEMSFFRCTSTLPCRLWFFGARAEKSGKNEG